MKLCKGVHADWCHWTALSLVFAGIVGGGAYPRPAVAQGAVSNAITITSPAPGTVVQPGQSLQVVVSVAAGSNFGTIQVIGKDIGISLPQEKSPFSFVLTIPNNIIGPRDITALGISGAGNGAFSQPVAVDVEVQTPITAMTVTPSRIGLSAVGDEVNLTVIGEFADGTSLDITNSSQTSYKSINEMVATVPNNGVVKAVGVGTTGILVKYGDTLVPVPVSVLPTGKTTTEASIYSAPDEIKVGQPVTLTAFVQPTTASGTPTGTVVFWDTGYSSAEIGQANLVNGVAQLKVVLPSAPDLQWVKAVYMGDPTFSGCESPYIAENLTPDK